MRRQDIELQIGSNVFDCRLLVDGEAVQGIRRVLVDVDVDKMVPEVTLFYTAQPIKITGKALHVEHIGLDSWLDYNREAIA
ncbi:MAG: hypothetical protein Q8N51_00805 [Gammaproteobacteria bacterium]|nr:hypothetical protein [Gammaproteobacteria bacterium]